MDEQRFTRQHRTNNCVNILESSKIELHTDPTSQWLRIGKTQGITEIHYPLIQQFRSKTTDAMPNKRPTTPIGMMTFLKCFLCASVKVLLPLRLKYVNAKMNRIIAPSTSIPMLMSRNIPPKLYKSIVRPLHKKHDDPQKSLL